MSVQLRLMSFNLRYDKPDPGEQNWTQRREAIATLISHYQPDIIGTQEAKAHQLLDLHRKLPDYQSVGRDRTGTGTDEHCAVFYQVQRFRCLETGDFALSETPEQLGSVSPTWGNPLPRMATWAIFAKDRDFPITVFNTHLDYHSSRARELGASLICDRIRLLGAINTSLFLTGDFNATPTSYPREIFQHQLTIDLQLCDILAAKPVDEQMTYHEFTGAAFSAVDTIYHDSRVQPRSVKVDTNCWQGIWPSDHFPVIADFVISAPEPHPG